MTSGPEQARQFGRPVRGRRPWLAGLSGYALTMTAAGVSLAIGFGPGGKVLPADADLAPSLAAAPVLPVQPPVGPARGASPAAAVPPAKLARGAQAGDPFQPGQLLLPGGAVAPVRASGLHADGSLVIPEDPAVVGWWSGGALAGDAFGSVVIAGHVDSARYGLGVMAQLRTLEKGQVIEIRSGTRRSRYEVMTRTSLPQAELAARTDAFRQDVPPRLVLITCGGSFDPVRHRYQDNLIVYARPLT